jgi:hypothetical protein
MIMLTKHSLVHLCLIGKFILSYRLKNVNVLLKFLIDCLQIDKKNAQYIIVHCQHAISDYVLFMVEQMNRDVINYLL